MGEKMKDYFDKFKDLEGEEVKQEKSIDETIDKIVLEANDPREKEVLKQIVDGDDIYITKKSDDAERDRFRKLMYRLGYQFCSSCSDGEGFRKAEWSPEFLVVDYVKKHYDDLIEPIIDAKEVDQEENYLIMSLVKNKEGKITEEEKTYIAKAIDKKNARISRDTFTIKLWKEVVEDRNEFVEKSDLELEIAKYDPTYGDTDFNVSFEDIDNDGKHRADLLLDLLLKDPLRGRSSLNDECYQLVIAACSHYGRWYNLRRNPLVHYYALKEYPKDMKLPRKFVEGLFDTKRKYAPEVSKVLLSGVIDRAFRIENQSAELEIKWNLMK